MLIVAGNVMVSPLTRAVTVTGVTLAPAGACTEFMPTTGVAPVWATVPDAIGSVSVAAVALHG